MQVMNPSLLGSALYEYILKMTKKSTFLLVGGMALLCCISALAEQVSSKSELEAAVDRLTQSKLGVAGATEGVAKLWARRKVEVMGGSIEIRQHSGGGTVVVIDLPDPGGRCCPA